MSAEATYSVTFVRGKEPMITVRADDPDEWKTNLDRAAQSGALAAIKAINDSLNGVRPDPAQGASGTPPVSQASPSAQGATAGGQPEQELPASLTGNPKCETCGAGTAFVSEGVSQRSGRPYRRFSCTANQLHKATFI